MESKHIIECRDLGKTYQVPVRAGGLKAAVKSLVRRQTLEAEAVKHVNFAIPPGEIVGFLGPNGAGKTTTLKMLSGLLHPSSGTATVLGHTPFQRERAYLREITLVMGNRNQLIWDIPVIDSFQRNRAIYRLSADEYRSTLDELTDLLDLEELIQKPARNLSLGERMRCEMAIALLHRPQILFLDEPTLGLDLTVQRRIRAFIADYNRKTGATVLLTSHYMADVEALCRRVIVIHNGSLLFDGDLQDLADQVSPHKIVVVELDREDVDLSPYGKVVSNVDGCITLNIPKADTARVTGKILTDLPVTDLTVQDPPIEDVIETVFASPKAI